MEWKLSFTVNDALPGVTLETSLVEWKQVFFLCLLKVRMSLGNFLSGMETLEQKCKKMHVVTLGNFLSGMETELSRETAEITKTLETSLVEWKPVMASESFVGIEPWKLP